MRPGLYFEAQVATIGRLPFFSLLVHVGLHGGACVLVNKGTDHQLRTTARAIEHPALVLDNAAFAAIHCALEVRGALLSSRLVSKVELQHGQDETNPMGMSPSGGRLPCVISLGIVWLLRGISDGASVFSNYITYVT